MLLDTLGAFTWNDGYDRCTTFGYQMAYIPSNIEHLEITNIIENTPELDIITSCWLGALGFLIPTSPDIIWSWVAPNAPPWNITFAQQHLVDPGITIPEGSDLGLYFQNRARADTVWTWSYSASTLSGTSGRQCVICFDNSTSSVFIYLYCNLLYIKLL